MRNNLSMIDSSWSQTRDFMPLFRGLDDIFADFFEYRGTPKSHLLATADAKTRAAAQTLAVEVEENQDHYLLSFDVPGLDKNNIDISIENGVLKVAAERKSESKEETKNVHFSERFYGRFERRFSLPENANKENIEADYTNGVLKVAVQKLEQPKPQKISVGEGKSSFFNKLVGKINS